MNPKPHHKAKQVKDEKTGKVFPSVKIAAVHAKCSRTHLANQLNGNLPNKTTLKYVAS